MTIYSKNPARVARLAVTASACAGALMIFLGGSGGAGAADIKFHIRNGSPYTVHVEFYSQNFNRVWPGGGQVYVLDDSGTHDFNLACAPGERVCYGAWSNPNRNHTWGAGFKGREGCTDCCGTCGANIRDVNLVTRPAATRPPVGQRID